MRHLVGLIGSGIAKSGSPAIHEREARHLGISLHYHLIDLETNGRAPARLPQLLAAAQHLGFSGLNITHPCKQAVIPFLDELSPEAQAIGAVNTVVFRNGRRLGHNTDWSGFHESLLRGLPGAPLESVLLIGAGGGGSAICYAALRLGIQRLYIFDQDPTRSENLARQFTGRTEITAVPNPAAVLPTVDGLIHATPLGMADHPGLAVAPELLRPALWVADIVYFPLETELLRAAHHCGCRTLDGGGMAVFQAAEAFRYFTGVQPDRERMLAEFRTVA